MPLGARDVERLQGAPVEDEKGEPIGRLGPPHDLDGELVGVRVRLDAAFATMPGIGRDELEVSPRHLDAREDGSVRMRMDLMDAIRGEAPPGGGPS